MIFWRKSPPIKKNQSHLAVRFKQIDMQTTKEKPQVKPVSSLYPIKKTLPKKAPQTKKSSVNKKKTIPAPTPQKHAVPKELVKQLEESVAKIEKKRDNRRAQMDQSPLQIEQLPSEEKIPEVEESAHDALIRILKESLHLPEYGEVKIELTIKMGDGSVTHLSVLHSKSEANRKYLEKTLKSMVFSLPEKKNENNQEQTFTLLFSNE